MIAEQSMTMGKQQDAVFSRYHGAREIVSQLEKFLDGHGTYSDVWTMIESKNHGWKKLKVLLSM